MIHLFITVALWILAAAVVFYVIGFAFIGAVWLYVNVAYQLLLFRKWLAGKVR